MSDEKKVQVEVVIGFQLTKVVDDELQTTIYEPGEKVELDADTAREEATRNRVRIVEEA